MTYDVILADPPWSFEVWDKETGHGRSPESHYATMPLSDIKALKIPANGNAALFMWAVWPSLPDAFEVIREWGFTYKTVAWVWAKANESGFGHHMGMGYYTRANTEPCLLAVRGTMAVAAHDVLALIYSPVREHSRKPDEQYDKIERLYPGRRYLELFARHKRPGWHAWGNEVDSDVKIETASADFSGGGR